MSSREQAAAIPALRIRVLGPTVLEIRGRAIDLGGQRQRQLVAVLVLQRNQVVPVDDLADRLWPDELPATAAKTIQVYVSRIRQQLGSEASRLETVAGAYRLRLADDELDVGEFEAAIRRGRAALATEPGRAEEAFSAALETWRGPALADVSALPIGRAEADRLDALRADALDERDEARIRTGRAREAIARLGTAVRERPDRERTWALLMRALYADGRQVEALAAYQKARSYLADELGLEPGPELAGLEMAILRHEVPGIATSPVAGTTPPSAVREGRLVRTMPLAGLATGLVAILVAAVILRPGPSTGATGTAPAAGTGLATGSPVAATARPSPSLVAAQAIVVPADPGDGTWVPSEVPAGRWTWSAFQPSLSFTTGLTLFAGQDLPDGAQLLAFDPPDARTGGVTWEIDFIRPQLVIDSGCFQPDSARVLEGGAADFVAYLQGHRFLAAGVVHASLIGRHAAFSLDVDTKTKTSADCPQDAGNIALLRRIPLFPAATHRFPLFAGDRARFVIADLASGPPIVLIVRAKASDFDSVLEVAQPILDSIETGS